MMSRSKSDKMLWLKLSLDALALLAQLSGALVWPILQWTLPNEEVIKSSSRVSESHPPLTVINDNLGLHDVPLGRSPRPYSGLPRVVGRLREREFSASADPNDVRSQAEDDRRDAVLRLPLGLRSQGTQTFFERITECAGTVSSPQGVAFFLAMWVIVWANGVVTEPLNLFKMVDFDSATRVWVQPTSENVLGDNEAAVSDAFQDDVPIRMETVANVPLHLFLIQICCTYAAYIFSKFACKVQIQGFR